MLQSKLGTSLPLHEGVLRTAEQGPYQAVFCCQMGTYAHLRHLVSLGIDTQIRGASALAGGTIPEPMEWHLYILLLLLLLLTV